MDSEYRVRPGDELVEPMFAALGAREAEVPPRVDSSPKSAGQSTDPVVGPRSSRWWWAIALPIGLLAWELSGDWLG